MFYIKFETLKKIFRLGLFSQLLNQLFVEIREVLHTYSDDKLIETCSKTMAYLCSDNSITFKCSEETKRIIESYIEKFKCEINDWEKYDNVMNLVFPM